MLYLKLLRNQRNEYQRDVAKATGVSERQYSRIESGVNTPSYKTILALESHFGKPIKELLAEAPEDTNIKTVNNPIDDSGAA